MKPALIPALPRPAQARPIIRALDVGAAAQMRDPISKITIEQKKTFLMG
jgi:hypothetical protein